MKKKRRRLDESGRRVEEDNKVDERDDIKEEQENEMTNAETWFAAEAIRKRQLYEGNWLS
jgi:hypothetical protein